MYPEAKLGQRTLILVAPLTDFSKELAIASESMSDLWKSEFGFVKARVRLGIQSWR